MLDQMKKLLDRLLIRRPTLVPVPIVRPPRRIRWTGDKVTGWH